MTSQSASPDSASPSALVQAHVLDDAPIGVLMLDHAGKRNALSHAMVEQLIAGLTEFTAQKVRAVLLRAAPGSPVWSAGHDVNELPDAGRDPLGWDDPLRHLVREIENCPAPVIAMVDRGVWGGACEVVFACDLICASPEASFAITPARLGVPYNVGGMLTFLNASGMRIAKEMAFTAKPVGAERAERLGLINHLVPTEVLEMHCVSLARQIAANAPLSIAVMKEELRILGGAHPMSPQGFERIQGLRRLVYDSADYTEGIQAFKQKRPPRFTGS
ncbi:MAG: methylmalonyl-CoA decarboxylase, biotin-independent [Pseudomonadota bacterium]|jgi:methylmalonyl-CoA decarboxylase